MHLFHILIVPMDALSHKDAQHKCKHRHKIASAVQPVSLKEIGAEQHNIARLCVCKHFAAAKVSISVLQATGKDNKRCSQQRFGHLSVRSKSVHSRFSFEKIVLIIWRSFFSVNNRFSLLKVKNSQCSLLPQNVSNRAFISSSVSSPRSDISKIFIASATAAFHSSTLIFFRFFFCFNRL